jgi:hypothetical protein
MKKDPACWGGCGNLFKLRIPYSGVIGLIAGLIIATPWASAIAIAIASCVELINLIIIYINLSSRDEFKYDSFVGHLLLQYVVFPEVSFVAVLHLVCARITSYIIAFIILLPTGFSLWLLIIPITLFLSTILHYIPKEKSL